MASPFASFNDAVLKPENVEKKFKELYPRDRVIYSSSGFIVPRIFKGNRKRLGFPTYGNHHLGALVVSNKRLFFWNQRRSPYNMIMKFLIPALIGLILTCIILLALGFLLIQGSAIALFPAIPSAILMTMVVPLMLHQHREVMMEKKFTDAKAIRLNTMRTIWIKYDKIDFYDGNKTVHFTSYHPYNDDVVRLIRALKVGDIM